jgi:tetratricopeptide (TPR) repeat protein
MHSYVHSWTVYVLNQDWEAETAALAIECVGSHVPNRHSYGSWTIQRWLNRHATRSWSFVVNCKVSTDNTSVLVMVNNLGILYRAQGRLADAKDIYQRALQGREKALGAEHTSTLNIMNNLRVLYQAQGKLIGAEEMYQRAQPGYEKALGPDHPKPQSLRRSSVV